MRELENQSVPKFLVSSRTIVFAITPHANATYLLNSKNLVNSLTFSSGQGPLSPLALKNHSMTIATIGKR